MRSCELCGAPARYTVRGEIALVLQTVAEHFEISVSRMRSTIRQRRHVEARTIALFLLRQRGYSLADAGEALGGRHHTTVLAACRRVDRSPRLKRLADHIGEALPMVDW